VDLLIEIVAQTLEGLVTGTGLLAVVNGPREQAGKTFGDFKCGGDDGAPLDFPINGS
jgi:hypothetical protein